MTTHRSSMRENCFLAVVFLLTSLLQLNPAMADDTEIYTDLETCDAVPPEKYRFIFIVDNSGSMSASEFAASKATIDAAAASLLNGELNDPDDPDDMKLAVVQYGSESYEYNAFGGLQRKAAGDINHLYDISVPFTDSIPTAQNWQREYGYVYDYGLRRYTKLSGEDHQPAALTRMRQDNVYAGGGALDVSDATNVQFVFFTDAWRDDWSGGCCSVLVNDSDRWHGGLSIFDDFGEYDALKDGSVLPNGLKAQFTILHVPPNGTAGAAAAAIASPGGDYVGSIEYNAGDPEGPGTLPRRYVQGTFDVQGDTDKIVELLEQVQAEIRDFTFTKVAPAISVNAFNQLRHRNEIYYSIFEPSASPRWGGNVKRFRITGSGELVDVNGSLAIDKTTGAIASDAKSFWTDGAADGPKVDEGGFRGELDYGRTIYTEPEAFETSPGASLELVQYDSLIKYESLGMDDCPADDSGGGSADSDAAYSGYQFVPRRVWTTITDGISGGSFEAQDGGSIALTYRSRSRNQARFVITNEVDETVTVTGSVYGGNGSRVRTLTVDMNNVVTANPGFGDAGSTYDVELEFYAYHSNASRRFIDFDIAYSAAGEIDVDEDDCPIRREQLLGWLEGRDMFNELTEDDEADILTTSHGFAADPLHSRPFVITYAGTSSSDAEDVMFEADNLGMLRAIDTSNGEEIWSFIPEKHLDNVQRYAYDQANLSKDYGLDGQISVIQRESSGSSSASFSLDEVTLFVGERRGGSSYYSIDVTDAHNGNKPKLNWSITGGSGDFSDLAQSWSAMQPAKVFTNCDAAFDNCTETEVLVFSGGYDPAYDADGPLPSDAKGNAIFIVDVQTGNLLWSAGNNSDANGGHSHDLSLNIEHGIPSTPTVIDINGDGGIDMIFAIDISGEIWRIDLDPTKSMGGSGFATGGQIADISTDGRRHFYAPLDISLSGPSSGASRLNIAVGSGFRAQPNDSSDARNRIYVIYDPYVTKRTGVSASQRYKYVDNSSDIIKVNDLYEVGTSRDDTRTYHGLYLNLVDSDEKILEPTLTLNNTVIATSFVPGASDDGTCGTGSGRVYFIDLNTGSSVFSNDYVELDAPGIPPAPQVIHLDDGLALCIGTQCVLEDDSLGGGDDDDADPNDDPCDSGNFSGGDPLQTAFSASTCGLDRGRGYRSYWRSNN